MQGISAPSRTLCVGALAFTGLCSTAHAASSVPRFIGVIADDPEHSDPVVSADALSALVGGAQEVGVSILCEVTQRKVCTTDAKCNKTTRKSCANASSIFLKTSI